MTARYPSEDELRARIVEHLDARPGDPLVSSVWHGYLSGLLEWGVIDAKMHSRLFALLPESGRVQAVEVLLEPEYVDAHPELREKVQQPRVA